MDFARSQLEKYGWKDGEGLGKNKTGIADALKPKLKNNRGGLGHDPAEEFTYNWWEHSFNAAANRITVENKNEGVKVKSKKSSKCKKISTKRPNVLIDDGEDSTLTYGRFKKTVRLVGSGEERLAPEIEEMEKHNIALVEQLSDEQLFQACGGRTAHKAARHGLGLNGKLARLEQQEKCATLPTLVAEVHKKNDCDKPKKKKKQKV